MRHNGATGYERFLEGGTLKTKLLLLLAVCMAALIGAELPGASAERGREAEEPERTADAAVGASISHPDEWVVEREQYSYDGTRGFKLWKADRGAARDHGGTPEVRVALAADLERGDIGRRVRERIAEYPDLRLTRETVKVGEKGLKGTAVGPIPGSTPYVEVYVPVEDRVYQISVYGTKLDDEGRRLLGSVRFDPPSRSASSVVEAPDASNPETFYRADAKTEELKKREEAAHKKTSSARSSSSSEEPTRSASALPVYGEYQIAEGCWRADSRFFVQTQHGYGANKHTGDGIATGYTAIGDQIGSHYGNFWGQYTHGNYGYGRCVSPYYVNDMYALDYPLNSGKNTRYYYPGDVVFSPFNGGTVTFAGRNSSHANYGIFVVIRADNGKYVNLSAHLSALATGIRPGTRVTSATIIGYAGDTGNPSIPVGTAHLHQGFYRYPYGYYPGRTGYKPDGSPYGGQGLQVIYHRYTGIGRGVPSGVHQFSWPAYDTSSTRTKGELIGN